MKEQTPTIARKPDSPLKKGWTTGACATAATKAALTALITGEFPDPVGIILPKGDVPYFPLALASLGEGYAIAGIIKDAGDDPDVTHGATIIATVHPAPPGSGIIFKAGEGVGTVTRAGLPIKPGEAAINPVPRQLMRAVCEELCCEYGLPADLVIIISVPNGAEIAQKTMNGRLGIVGGISILGTTGVVNPFSCSSWIHSIHRGIDVARAAGQQHIIAATGSTSEEAAQKLYDLPEFALIDMGDFIGGVLKYLRHHPINKITLAGGFAKLTKFAQGALDLHSSRSSVDFKQLWQIAQKANVDASLQDAIINANTAKQVLDLAGSKREILANFVAQSCQSHALNILQGTPVSVEIIITDREGSIIAQV